MEMETLEKTFIPKRKPQTHHCSESPTGAHYEIIHDEPDGVFKRYIGVCRWCGRQREYEYIYSTTHPTKRETELA